MPDNSLETIQFDDSWLKGLYPISELHEASQRTLAKNAKTSRLSRGDKIKASDEHHWMVYLIDGSIDIIVEGRVTRKINADSSLSKKPLFKEKEYYESAYAVTDCQVVRFDREYFNTLVNQDLLDGEQFETIEVDESEGYLFTTITHAFNEGDLQLPALPDIAVKVKNAVSNVAMGAEQIAKILEADPAIVARLIQVANSPINKGVQPVTNIRAAVVRLGLGSTRDLVVCLAIKQLFKAQSGILQKRMQTLYEESTEIAAIAYAIAKHATSLDPEDMLLAGLVHDIGVIPILSYIDSTGMVVDDMSQVEAIIKDLRSVVGSMVVSSWGLSSDLLMVVENVENWHRHESDTIDACDIILVAQIYYHLHHREVKGLPKLDEVPAYHKIFKSDQGLVLIKTILSDAEDEVKEVKRLLSG